MAAAGYEAPSSSDLSAVGLDCSGDLREKLWQSLGWASPWPLEDESSAMDLLGLEEKCWLFHEALGQRLHQWLRRDELECRKAVEQVKLITGCFLEICTCSCNSSCNCTVLRAVGGSTELSAVEPAFGEILAC